MICIKNVAESKSGMIQVSGDVEAGLQISLKIRLRSEAKAKIFSRKIAKRSEAKKIFVCAKRSEANNFSKLRKIAKKCEIAKKFSNS